MNFNLFRRFEDNHQPIQIIGPAPALSQQIRLRKQPCEEEIQISINKPIPLQTAIMPVTTIATSIETNVEEPVDFEIIEMPDVEDQKKTS